MSECIAMTQNLLHDLFSSEDRLALLCVFGTGLIIGLASIIGYYWRQIERTRADCDLKRLMIERGMSAGEIERILAAQSPDDRRPARRPTPDARLPRAQD
jgi:hypothetical protein